MSAIYICPYNSENYAEFDEKMKVFFDECTNYDYINNTSYKSIKLFDESLSPSFLIAHDGLKIIAMSGVHAIDSSSYRLSFRSCSLMNERYFIRQYYKMWWRSSLVAGIILPLQIKQYRSPEKKLYITTNVPDQSSFKKHHKVNEYLMPLMEKRDLVFKEKQMSYFGCMQNFWKLNEDKILSEESYVSQNLCHSVEYLA